MSGRESRSGGACTAANRVQPPWLSGCITYNIWHTQDGERVKLSVEDLHALQELKRK